jgi:hypothetical protein
MGHNIVKSSCQMHPVLDSSSFAPVLVLPCRTCLHSASSVLAVRTSCRIIAVSVFRKPLFTNKLYHIYVLNKYHIIYSVCYYLLFHVTTVGLGTYYLRIRGHTCSSKIVYNRTQLLPGVRMCIQHNHVSHTETSPGVLHSTLCHKCD